MTLAASGSLTTGGSTASITGLPTGKLVVIEIYDINSSSDAEVRAYLNKSGTGSNSYTTTHVAYAENDGTVGNVSKNYIALTGFSGATAKPQKGADNNSYYYITIGMNDYVTKKFVSYYGTYKRPDGNYGTVTGGGGVHYTGTTSGKVSSITFEVSAGTIGNGVYRVYYIN